MLKSAPHILPFAALATLLLSADAPPPSAFIDARALPDIYHEGWIPPSEHGPSAPLNGAVLITESWPSAPSQTYRVPWISVD